MNKSNYDKYPYIRVSDRSDDCLAGWDAICDGIKLRLMSPGSSPATVVIECYQGVLEDEIVEALQSRFEQATVVRSAGAMKPAAEINNFFRDDITGDELFGYMTRHNIDSYFDPVRTEDLRRQIRSQQADVTFIVGTGAAHVCPDARLLIYADMARWEIQQRFRRSEVANTGAGNRDERASLQYKRAFFVDWRICDRFKKSLMKRWDYVLDTCAAGRPKMITRRLFEEGLAKAAGCPFRVAPFFDPGPWGGQWMKEVFDLDRKAVNYAWCFDCVPEENSLLLGFGDIRFEIPAIDLVFAHPRELLGDAVHGRFGDEFPIRFDFLDTMQGGNLSLQVHPPTEYIQEKFGMHYTQDESYYILDAGDDACVYLGLKDGVNPEAMLSDLRTAQKSGTFDAEKYACRYPIKKHDHILIPAGTVHCSGANSMVLEISATPFIFTFKLWDWGRLGLDGRPRPLNIDHGARSIQWNRTESWVKREILNRAEEIVKGDGWTEERTGLHEREFIETRRHRFTGAVRHRTGGGVNVLNLIEGREATVESPHNAFEPFVVHYAETFIVPAGVDEYIIRPSGESEGQRCATIKAYIRNQA
ncbi:MAG: class I mannose-6-phosphate isomerase [Tannerella sp.]|jgi:mannose-6-phosphate isomerase class I|nr:class I mannose-6-phosphate isomerase [Tannerella sp.]